MISFATVGTDVPAVAVVAALASAASWAIASLLFERRLSRAREAHAAPVAPPSPAAANLFKNTLAGACFLLWFAFGAAAWPAREAWPWLLASGAFGFALGDTLYFAALPRAGVQVAALVGLVHAPAAVGLEALVSGTWPPVATLGAMLVILLGVALVLSDAPGEAASREGEPDATRAHDVRAARTRRRVGVLCAFAGAVAQAVGVVVGHRGMGGTDLAAGTLVRLSGGIAGAFVVAAVVGLARGRTRAETARLVAPFSSPATARALVVAATFGSIVGLPLFHLALRDLSSGVAAVLFATTPLFTLPLAAWSGARVTWRSVLGTVLGFAGVVGVTWSLG